MISLNNIPSAGRAMHYFSADNYYTQDQGLEKSEWFGQGAHTLGLVGQIDQQRFFETLSGRVGNQELGRFYVNQKTQETEREHRPGLDVTFSAPKSVSLLAEVAGNRDVRDAHEKAVKVALTYIEKEMAQTRQICLGQLEAVKTGNLVVALFRHNTSRDLDPQTHTHAVIMNATEREDGKWRSTFNDEIWNSQRLLGAIYIDELASNLQQLGYQLERTDNLGNFEIVGVTRDQVKEFSRRRAEIIASLKERGIDIGSASAQLKEDATLMTRSAKTDVDHDALIAAWKDRADAAGIDFEEIEARADALREQGGVQRADQLSGRDAIDFATAHLIEREIVVTKNDLLRTALEHGVGRVAPTEVIEAFDALVKEGHLVELPEGVYTTAKMLGREQWLLEQVNGEQGVTPKIMALETINAKLDKAERQHGFTYSEGQRGAIGTILGSEERFVAVQGLAGTGKSTMLKTLREMAQGEGYTVRGMAPTGAAAKVMARETGVATDTVAMFLIKERQLSKDIAYTKEHVPEFTRKPELWVVDESSFVSQRHMAQLHYMANKAGAKVAYLGDQLQLHGVEAGKPFELAQKAGIETAYMTEISRQKTPVLKEAVDMIVGRDRLKEGEKLTDVALLHNARAFNYLDKKELVNEIDNEKLIDTLIQDIVTMNPAERERTLVITAFNADRHAINNGVRGELQGLGEVSTIELKKEIFLSKGWTRAEKKEAQYYEVKDVVRFGREYQQIAAAKGEYLRVIGVEATNGIVTLKKENGLVLQWEPKKHTNVEVYKAESRYIAQGDMIRMTRNDGQFKNGETARVVELQGDIVKLEVKQGNEVSHHIVDLSNSKHWDYAYSSTVHFSQGATQYRTLFHINVPENESDRKQEKALQAMAKVFGDRSFYVGSTRASHEMKIYTNNKKEALKVVVAKQDKTSAVEQLGIEKQIRQQKAH